MKKFLIGALIFIVFIVAGGIFRLTWFFTHQKTIFEKKYLYKDLVESKLGGKTPQETWNLYLDALEKEDINLAVQYWVPEERENIKKVLNEYKKAGALNRYAKNFGRELQAGDKPFGVLLKNEKSYFYEYISEKDLDFVGIESAEKEYKNFIINYWDKQELERVKSLENIIFMLNSYSRKWLIKE